MSALSIQPTFPIFTETDGQPLENGYIWIGTANLDPQVNPINVYWDAALTIAAPQPIRTINGYPSRNGTPGRLYVNSDYSIRVMSRNGSTVYSALAATERFGNLIDASGVTYQLQLTGTTQTTVEEAISRQISVQDFSADDTGAISSSLQIQKAIDEASLSASSGTSQRTKVSLKPGGFYKLDASIRLKNVTLDATGASFLLTNNAGFLVGSDCAFISADTLIECEAGWDGVVFKRDPALSGAVGKINMIGRPYIYKAGALDKTTGIVLDMTGLLASSFDFQSYNFEVGVLANTQVSSDQTYYNTVKARITGVDYGIRLRTGGFQGINGNSFNDISIGDCNIGIELIEGVLGAGGGPSANNFYINYIEKCATYGIHLNGETWHNTFIGGIIEPQNDVICIRNAGGKYNTFDMNVVPPSGNKGLESILGAEKNNYFLRRFGTFITWSKDVGPSAAYSTGTGTKTYIGNTVPASYTTHNSATPTVSLSDGVRTVVLSGAGTITGIDSAALTEVDSVVFVGNGSATIQHNAAVTYPFRITGGANVTPPAEARITFQRIPGVSNAWWEESRSW